MDEQNDNEKGVDEKQPGNRPQEPWHQRHFPVLLMGGMVVFLALLIFLASLSE